MNSLEMDLKRAICSVGFLAGFIFALIALFQAGFDSELFRVSFPVAAALPYAKEWLVEYQSGYIRAYLPRSGRGWYILGKFLACGISGGLALALACWIFMQLHKDGPEISLSLVFASGMLWAVTAATLAAWTNSRYIAYGGGFVLYYMLVILCERYFESLYCLYPYEWLAPKHTWLFGEAGVLIMLSGIILVLFGAYYEILRRCLEHV